MSGGRPPKFYRYEGAQRPPFPKRVFPPTCQAGPAWNASDAGRVCARAIVATADILTEGGWSEAQVRAFVGGCLDLHFAEVRP